MSKDVNLFGDATYLSIDLNTLTIPTVEATDEFLGFYNATLIQQDDSFFFPHDFPLFKMDMGNDYCKNYVTNQCEGTFLEFHHGQPHFHMPIKTGGVYILAKWSEKKTSLMITGFKLFPTRLFIPNKE